MIVTDNKTAKTHVRFANGGLVEAIHFAANSPAQWGSKASVNSGASASWDFGLGWQGALNMAESGWYEGAAKIDQALADMPDLPLASIAKRRIRQESAYAGHRPNVARFLAGHPKSMVRNIRDNVASPIVALVVNFGISASRDADEMMHYGIALCAHIDALERAGFRVQLDVALATKIRKGGRNSKAEPSTGIIGWRVKQAQESVSLADLAFSIANPAAMRRIGFALIERLPKAIELYTYGTPGSISADDLPLIDAPSDAVIMPGLSLKDDECRNASEAAALVARQFETYSGKLERQAA
jgi:hypothetical protein